MTIKTNDDSTDKPAEGEGEQRRVFFRAVSVFDRSQVTEIPGGTQTPLDAPCEPLTGESHGHLLEPLTAFAAVLGFSVAFEAIPGATGGWCEHQRKRIVVDAKQPVNGQVRVLVRELADALGVGYREYGRQKAEVIVDTAIVSICQAGSR